MNRPWNIQLFGQLRAERNDKYIERFRTEKTGALLAYLAFYPSVPASRESLIEIFWPDYSPEAGSNCLSIALHSLRSQFEPPEIARGSVFFADRNRIYIKQESIQTDVSRFETAAAEALQKSPSSEKIQQLEDAIALYHNSLLPEYYEDWIVAQRTRLEDSYFALISHLTRLLIQRRRYYEAMQYTHQVLASDPMREEFVRILMSIHVALKQPSVALETYTNFRDRLLVESLEPASKTSRLAEEIRRAVANLADEPPLPTVLLSPPFESSMLTGTITLVLVEANVKPDAEPSQQTWQQIVHTESERSHGLLLQESHKHLLIAFRGVGEAMQCATDVHRHLSVWENPLSFRIALHTGDHESQEQGVQDSLSTNVTRLLMVTHDRQILCSQVTASIIQSRSRPVAHLKALGLYRWRLSETPERLYQVLYEGIAQTTWPAPPGLIVGTPSLPSRRSRFFGRLEEYAYLTELLRSRETRLLTLKGPGGIGKTRLAQELMGALVITYPHAVWFVSIGELTSASAIPKQILDALRISPDATVSPIDQIVDFLFGERSLLVLDNFEHLLLDGSRLVTSLLDRLPQLTCLITSRRRLGLEGEHEWNVRPLAVPAEENTLEQLADTPSIQLFIDRAQNVHPDFHLTAQNAFAVRQICTRLDGIPLAIELAASRIHTLTPQQMVSQLDYRFDFLKQPRRDSVERQRTMRAAVDWSYRLLEPELQAAFRQLSVFRGGWTAEAAEAVCATSMPHDLLAQLLECSLIYSEERNQEIRFRMLETIRDFAALQLTPEERSEALRRHLEYYVILVERTERLLSGPRQAECLDLLEMEYENLRCALRTEDQPEWNLRLASALHQFWFVRGYLKEGLEQLEWALVNAPNAPDSDRARGLVGACAFATARGDFPRAMRFGEEAREVYQRIHHLRGLAGCLNNLSYLVQCMGDRAMARAYLEQSLEIYHGLGDVAQMTRVLANLGAIANEQGDYDHAYPWLNEGRTLAEKLGDRFTLAGILHNLGILQYRQKRLAEARTFYLASLAIWKELKDRHSVASVLNDLGILAVAMSEDDRAPQLFGGASSVLAASDANISPTDAEEVARAITEVSSRLVKQRFDELYSIGTQKSLEMVAEFAAAATDHSYKEGAE